MTDERNPDPADDRVEVDMIEPMTPETFTVNVDMPEIVFEQVELERVVLPAVHAVVQAWRAPIRDRARARTLAEALDRLSEVWPS